MVSSSLRRCAAIILVAALGTRALVQRLMAKPHASQGRADRLADQVRLAHTIADEAARTDIEEFCVPMSMGNHVWYDTTELQRDTEEGSDVPEYVERARTYLHMRGQLVEHPTQPALVRFPT